MDSRCPPVTACLLFALTLFLACAIRTSDGTSEWDLTAICSHTVEKDLCVKFLRSDPRTDSSDPPLLSIVSIELSLKHAQGLLVTFTSFRENSTSAVLAKSYGQCVSNYLVIIDGLNKAYGFSNGKDYDNVIKATPPLSLDSSCENA
ncbi:hypothetical protein MLD38_009391 [Melastoma candidum]|uniref:Uncharacterized protein n=1 Tax=Melastoma candidum TaxID=119954 RepID=A0ACB9S144_9MYRT|nr:hypothetical protein MLD38_009391 [Melastoma candidum]